MSHAFAKDSRACAACVSWGGERALSPDLTLVHVARYSVEGECRTAVSQDYRRVTKSFHTCDRWAALPMMKSHGGLRDRPGPVTAAAPRPAAVPVPPPAAVRPTVPAAAGTIALAEPEPPRCFATPLDFDKTPAPARVLFSYWSRLRHGRAMPAAHEIDTGAIRECVSRLSLMAPVAGGADFAYRSCGRGLQRRMGRRPVTRTVSDCHPADAAARWIADLAACLKDGAPRCLLVRGDPLLPDARFVELLLPLADAEGAPSMVLCYRHLPGG